MLPLSGLKVIPSIAAVTLQYPATKHLSVWLEDITVCVSEIKCFTKVVDDGEN